MNLVYMMMPLLVLICTGQFSWGLPGVPTHPSLKFKPGEVQVYTDGLASSGMDSHGSGQPLCSMFGCECVPPPGSKCCSGYRFDGERCRKLN